MAIANLKRVGRAVKKVVADEAYRVGRYFDLRNDDLRIPASVIVLFVTVIAVALAYSPAWNK